MAKGDGEARKIKSKEGRNEGKKEHERMQHKDGKKNKLSN